MYHVLIIDLCADSIVGFGKTRARSPAHALTTVAQHHQLITLATAVEIQKNPASWPQVLGERGLAALIA